MEAAGVEPKPVAGAFGEQPKGRFLLRVWNMLPAGRIASAPVHAADEFYLDNLEKKVTTAPSAVMTKALAIMFCAVFSSLMTPT